MHQQNVVQRLLRKTDLAETIDFRGTRMSHGPEGTLLDETFVLLRTSAYVLVRRRVHGLRRHVCAEACDFRRLFTYAGRRRFQPRCLPDAQRKSTSVAGPLHKLGWNQQYIIFTDQNWPNPWSVIRVKDHSKFTISETQRLSDSAFTQISILSPQAAWDAKTH